MRGRTFLLCAAALLPWTAARADPLPANPDPAALEIARLMIASIPGFGRTDGNSREERQLEQNMLSVYGSEQPCDRANPECLAAAQAIAREFAPMVRQRETALRERSIAYSLSDRLRPEQLSRLAAFLRSEEGRLLVDAWQALWQPAPSRERIREIECRAREGLPTPVVDALTRFRERTAHLPRTLEKPPAIVMQPPTPPPPCPPQEPS